MKLFSMYPVSRGQDVEAAMAGYIETTLDLPVYWLSCALVRLIRDPECCFVPPVGKIREAAAREIRDAWRKAEGRTDDYNPHGPVPLQIERWIERGRQILGTPALPAGEPAVPPAVLAIVDQAVRTIGTRGKRT